MNRDAPSSPRDTARVVTNVITGFLGAGKSTAILHLLRHKPAGERWAVLVNEFGEVGIDGSLLQGHDGDAPGLVVREVPGGCMCCAAGLPMQVALTTLLARDRPDRLLIEPTGLGHPQEVLELLTGEYYRRVLDLRATITLVDARKVHDPRYTEHPTFTQQLAVADIIVANKADEYADRDMPALTEFLGRTAGLGDTPLFRVEHGAVQPAWLTAPAGHHGHDDAHAHHTDHDHPAARSSMPVAPEIPAAGFVRVDNAGEGYFSVGWIFAPSWRFDAGELASLLIGIDAERIKGVFLTEDGTVAYNMADGVLTTSTLANGHDSRVEVISLNEQAFADLEAALLACVVSR